MRKLRREELPLQSTCASGTSVTRVAFRCEAGHRSGGALRSLGELPSCCQGWWGRPPRRGSGAARAQVAVGVSCESVCSQSRKRNPVRPPRRRARRRRDESLATARRRWQFKAGGGAQLQWRRPRQKCRLRRRARAHLPPLRRTVFAHSARAQ